MTTYGKKRVAAACLLLFIVLSAANYYLSLGVFPRYAGLIMLLGVLMILVYVSRFRPTREEFDEHRKTKTGGGG